MPKEARNQKSINYLEFLACISGIIISLYEGEGARGDCFLSLGDNTSSLGWLRKSNFAADGDQASHSALARDFARLVAEHGVGHFGKWFPGKENEVADVLSRDHTRSDKNLTTYIKFLFAPQVSKTFQISPLPPAIISWLDYWVHHTPASTQSPPPLTTSKASTSESGTSSSKSVSSTATSTSTPSVPSTGKNSSAPSSRQSATKNLPLVQREMINWLRVHAVPTSTVYERPSAQMVDPIRRWTQTEKCHHFYTTNCEATPTTIPPPNNRNRSRSF